jgi:hypothetical protein
VTDEERQRIAREYGVTVPEGVRIEKIKLGVSGVAAVHSRHEAVQISRKVIQRGWKFQAAERKRRKNRGTTNES